MRQLAERYGTPLYVYQLAEVRAAAAALRAAVPEEARLFYSLKANPHPAVVGELVRAGLSSEVSSTAELAAALTAGQSPADCIMTGPGKTVAEVDDALIRGVRTFSLESEVDYARLADSARRHAMTADILLRLNAGSAAGRGTGLRMTGAATQFGMPVRTALDIIEQARGGGPLTPIGLHLFPATNLQTEADLLAEFTLSIDTAANLLYRARLSAGLVDIGGGFAAPFARPGARADYSGLRERLGGVLDERLPGWRSGQPRVAFESGRYLTATCGTLLTTVLDVKTSGGITYVVLDAGVNALGGMSGLGRILAPSVQPAGGPATGRAPNGGNRISLVGTLCTPLDVLSRSADIEVPRIGDVLEIPNVGAYGVTASLMGFLSKPVPAEVVVERDGSVVGARRLKLLEVNLDPDGADRPARNTALV
ncbi:type III PLP-dependent enzyme [Actinoplanes sp. NPDC051346]|uniref:type III PLP-dependent enzyme n=1 Tax=Actinoplanes sp. NPDC051346 TaxID=3155048 RepID=UPI00343B9342